MRLKTVEYMGRTACAESEKRKGAALNVIVRLNDAGPFGDLINDISADPDFSQPGRQSAEEIEKCINRAISAPDEAAFGVFLDGAPAGVFVFLILAEDRYIEMLAGLSREREAYEEIADLLGKSFPGWQVDFVFNPKNRVICEMLEKRGAELFTEQKKMVLKTNPAPIGLSGVEPLSDKYRDDYSAIHRTDNYWTGDRVLNAPDKFNVYIAADGGKVVGYIDVTKNNEENEPFDLYVLEGYRRRGWGRKLLAKAVEANKPKGMALSVDVDNAPAIALYGSMGFEDSPEPIGRVATWTAGWIETEHNNAGVLTAQPSVK